jgi:hypothetical protein
MAVSNNRDRLLWMQDARFGVFFHWGTYAVHERGEWARYQECTPIEEYEQLAYRFKPKEGWADKWMDLVVKSGARYAVLTAKPSELLGRPIPGGGPQVSSHLACQSQATPRKPCATRCPRRGKCPP